MKIITKQFLILLVILCLSLASCGTKSPADGADTADKGTSTESISTEGTSTEGTSTEGTSTVSTSTEGASTEGRSTESTSTESTSTEGTGTEGTGIESFSTECISLESGEKAAASGTTASDSASANSSAPRLTEINHYVLSPADEYYLTDEKMEGYRKALDAIFAHESKVQLTDSYDDNLAILGYLQDNPYTFVVSSYTFTKDHKGLQFQYDYSAEECTEMMNFIDQEYLALINESVTSDMTELEEVLAIYKYFAARIEYDHDWVEELNMSDEQYLFPDIVIYQALTTGKGVCHTYSYLCQFAYQQLGIDCVRATSEMTETGSGHMWLIVWIDGKPYHIDPTWDDTGDTASLRYFGMTDEENLARGLADEWSCFIDEALDINCTDTRFADWRDITDYNLIGNHRMAITRE